MERIRRTNSSGVFVGRIFGCHLDDIQGGFWAVISDGFLCNLRAILASVLGWASGARNFLMPNAMESPGMQILSMPQDVRQKGNVRVSNFKYF